MVVKRKENCDCWFDSLGLDEFIELDSFNKKIKNFKRVR